MFDAQVLTATSSTAVTLFSPWMPRGGDHAIQTLEIIAITGGTLKVEVFHKTSEDASDGTEIGVESTAEISATTVGRTVQELHNGAQPTTLFYPYKELWRYMFTFTPNASMQVVTFRMLPPMWYDAIKD